MSSEVSNILIQGCKEGVDQHGMDYDLLFSRTQDIRTPQSSMFYLCVESTYDLLNFAKTMEPRLAPYVYADAHNYKYMLGSFGSIRGITLDRVATTKQEHIVTQQSIQNKSKFEQMFKGKDKGPQQ